MTQDNRAYINLLREIVENFNYGESQASQIKAKLRKALKWVIIGAVIFLVGSLLWVAAIKTYEGWDDQPDRGAVALPQGWLDENYAQPLYIEQGWDAADSLWFYNTTQGSGLMPYDFFVSLEQPDTQSLITDNGFIDRHRYLPQQASRFNPDALPVGFVKDSYQGRDYFGFTCAACHTSQLNYGQQAIRIDGGPSMADMDRFLHDLQAAMQATLDDNTKLQRFIARVQARKNDYDKPDVIRQDLQKWTSVIAVYNTVNHVKPASSYGYARLDAFGRIYNRVLQHVINREQAATILRSVATPVGRPLLTESQITLVLAGMNDTIMGDVQFSQVLERLQSKEAGYPNLGMKELLYIRDAFFNPPDAPVSYPFLWDIAQSDYVQWNGLASNGGLGPIGRNAGEVIGVFGILDWRENNPSMFSLDALGARLSGQERKQKQMTFDSSIDLYNLGRLESHLKSLKSPRWIDASAALKQQGLDINEWQIDEKKVKQGALLYQQYCSSCHELTDRNNWDRIVVARMSSLDNINTDGKMAQNSVNYQGYSGNFANTYQKVDVGTVVIGQKAPVVQILTSATTGVVATPDPDKNFLMRFLDWVYTLISSLTENTIKSSVKVGNYSPDTTAQPYASLLSYKARSLNGIWATAPYLHNGSVPTLYDLLLPAKRAGDPEGAELEYRPTTFMVGKREFDPKKVGFKYQGYQGFNFDTRLPGNSNGGHEYASGRTAQPDGSILPAMDKEQRNALLEFLKTL
ncbi:di-heme-cytochrome C peroxidase [Aeromonas sp. AE23HZ002T15]